MRKSFGKSSRKSLSKSFFIISAVLLVIFAFTGCSKDSETTAVPGEWTLEAISSSEEGVLVAGKAYDQLEEFDGEKGDLRGIFKEEGTFEILGSDEPLNGEYTVEEKMESGDTVAMTLNFDDGRKSAAVVGWREYRAGEEVRTMTFSIDEEIYTFVKVKEIE